MSGRALPEAGVMGRAAATAVTAATAAERRQVIAASGIHKDYGGRRVLTVEKLAVEEGEVLAVVGPSGAGKSTLLRLLAGIEPPDGGQVRFSTDKVAFVPQRPAPFRTSVIRGILRSLAWHGVRGPQARRRAEEALEMVALAGFGGRFAPTLSGGEIQRLALARALALEPEVLLLDEPTANLDPANVAVIERVLTSFRKHASGHGTCSRTVVLVTHSLFQARRLADRVAFLWNGELVEAAPAERFFTAPRDLRTKAFVEGGLVY